MTIDEDVVKALYLLEVYCRSKIPRHEGKEITGDCGDCVKYVI